MKLPIIRWGRFPPKKDPFLIHVPFAGFAAFAASLDEMANKPTGLIPPCSLPDKEIGLHAWEDLPPFIARCMATTRDHFPDHHVYAPIFPGEPRPFLRAAKKEGFEHFILPYVEPFPHFYQEVYDLLHFEQVHVAGGGSGG